MNRGITWPLAYNRIRRGLPNHTFGMVRRNADGTRRPHQGWDFAAANGTPFYAVADGEIAAVQSFGDYGLHMTLAFHFDYDGDGDGDVLFAFYAHLQSVDVVPFQQVKKGQRLGLTGSTGNALGMKPVDQHLHFELRTRLRPDRGLLDRLSPMVIFGPPPLKAAVTVEQAA